MVKVTVKWTKQSFDVEVDQSQSVETFQTQIYTLTNVPPDRQKILGIPGGPLKANDDLSKRQIKEGLKVTLIGTAEGKEIQEPQEKVKFVEDMTVEERAKAMGENLKGPLPVGLANLGNTCYMNSVVQMLRQVPELEEATRSVESPSSLDGRLSVEFGQLMKDLSGSLGAVEPLRFLLALRAKCPEFAKKDARGSFAQQDAEECIRAMLSSFATAMVEKDTNAIDRLFGFRLRNTFKCAEAPDEPEDIQFSDERFMFCHFGTQTDPIGHLHQGLKMSLEDMVEKNSTSLGRVSQYTKKSALASSPKYLLVQFARFGWKNASTSAGTEASRVKIGRNVQFPKRLDLYEFVTPELKEELQVGRVKESEQKDRDIERTQQALKDGVNVEVVDTCPEGCVEAWYDTGAYDLLAVVTHAGRSADGGHYVGWAISERADGKKVKEDKWLLYDDDKVTEKLDREVDLAGGRMDAQIAYFCLYKKAPARIFEAPPAEKAKAEEEDPKKDDKAADTAPEAPMDVDA
jgi:ubiquitin carboxyl-terminal hydrolase 14